MSDTLTGIQVIYRDDVTTDGSKGLSSRFEQIATRVGVLDVTVFREQLSALCEQISGSFRQLEPSNGEFNLESFEVTVDLTAKGEVRLVGSVGIEAKGGVRLVFKRN